MSDREGPAEERDAVKVTISDPETGKVLDARIVRNDYALIVSGTCYVASTQIAGKTHTITIKGRK